MTGWKSKVAMANQTDYKPQLVIEQGTVYNVPYMVVRPIFEYWAGTEPTGWNEMISWCVSTYGPGPDDGVWTPNGRWYANNAKFWFREEKDVTMFILRWS